MPDTRKDARANVFEPLIIVERAVAPDDLSPTSGTALPVATHHMNLSFDYATAVAWMFVSTPVFTLFAVANTVEQMSANGDSRLLLGLLNSFRPSLDHRDTVANHYFGLVRHCWLAPANFESGCYRYRRWAWM